jgi:hypothetical protein
MKGILLIGAALAVLGLIGLAMPIFTTTDTKSVVKLGDLNVQAKEETPHAIPPLVSGGVLVIGVVLIGAAMLKQN